MTNAGAQTDGCGSAWEAAYLRFETPAEEIAKFTARLKRLGAQNWPKDSRIVELFCGRGSGLVALQQLGFTSLEGVDISAALLAKYSGPAKTHVADCRQLPFKDESKDILIVQGGLHHLLQLPGDLAQTLDSARRTLVKGGRFVAVEPWMTPFLACVHTICRVPPARVFRKIEALGTMIDHERETYENWLSQPKTILELFNERFEAEVCSVRWGKLMYVGRKK